MRFKLQWQGLFPVAASLAGYATVLFASPFLHDPDTYWHIKAGEWILQHRAVPHTDPFSYTFAGAPWEAHEWLSEVLMALAYGAANWNGIVLFFGIVVALTCWLLAQQLSRHLALPASFVVFALAAACVGPSLLARPHLLMLPILITWLGALLSAQEKGKPPSLWLLPLMMLWANLHGTFVLGLALVLPIAAEALIAAKQNRAGLARAWAGFLALAICASALTPNGWRGLIFPFQLLNMKHLSTITEWAPPNFETLQPLELALMATLYIAFTRPIKISIPRLLILMALLHLALHHGRHQILAGIAGALVLAEPVEKALRGKPRENTRHGASRGGLAAGAAIAVLLAAARIAHPIVRTDDRVSPVSALNHVPIKLRQQAVLNSYNFGGYLIFSGIKPFIDGRADMYGDRFIFDYVSLMMPSRAGLDHAIEKYGIQWMILKADSPVLDMLDTFPSWHRLYADDIAVVYAQQAQ